MICPETFKIIGFDEKFYFMTGSRALDNNKHGIKYSNDSSDYDFVVKIHVRHLILGSLVERGIKVEESCYNGGFRFCEGSLNFNVITAVDIEYDAWKNALEILKYLIESNVKIASLLKNKLFRYAYYEQLRGIYKAMITSAF